VTAKPRQPAKQSLATSPVRVEQPQRITPAGTDINNPRNLKITSVGLAAAILWSYWPVLGEMAQKWAQDPQYSHAYLVPLFAAYLLWFRRSLIDTDVWGPSWLGLPVLLVGVLMRLGGAFVFFDWLEAVSFLPILAGTVLMLAGPKALRWAWPTIAFLGFMIPLPYRLETALSLPLQTIATTVSTYVLQTLGRPAFAEGHIIVLNDVRIGVVEACNGLGMLLLFFAMATAVAIVVRRHPIEKAVIVATAPLVAIAANVVRIVVTCFAHEYLNSHWADLFFHDLAGWLMMPFALGLLGLELYLMSRMFVADDPRVPSDNSSAASRLRAPIPAQVSES
jgi:exosortase